MTLAPVPVVAAATAVAPRRVVRDGVSRSRRWCFTYNNYGPTDETAIVKWDHVKYLVIGKEVGESGTPHLQGFVIYDRMKSLGQLKQLLPTAHWEIAKAKSKLAADYCKKDKDFIEVGAIGKQGERNDLSGVCRDIIGGSTLSEVATENASTYVKFFRGLREFAMLMVPKYEHDGVRGLWIHGPPGCGKSRFARTFGDVYLKSQNKWWDGYDNQEVIVLDDFDKGGIPLGHHLKIWTDRYACVGETKGGTTNLRHKLFIVTSNYTMQDLFGEDDNLYRAILRRFLVFDFGLFPYRPEGTETRTVESVYDMRGEGGRLSGLSVGSDNLDILADVAVIAEGGETPMSNEVAEQPFDMAAWCVEMGIDEETPLS
jgi:Putative viral replication protein/RNA helicase